MSKDDQDDYEIKRVKVPKKNSKGNDVSGDKAGAGGRRDKSGKLSALYRPLTDEEEAEYEKRDQQKDQIIYNQQDQLYNQQQELDYYHQQEIQNNNDQSDPIDSVIQLLDTANKVTGYLADHPEFTIRLVNGAKKAKNVTVAGFNKFKSWVKRNKKETVEAELVEKQQSIITRPPRGNLTYDQAKQLFYNMVSSYFILANSDVTDAEGNIIDVNVDSEIDKIKSMIDEFPALKNDTRVLQMIQKLAVENNGTDKEPVIIGLLVDDKENND